MAITDGMGVRYDKDSRAQNHPGGNLPTGVDECDA